MFSHTHRRIYIYILNRYVTACCCLPCPRFGTAVLVQSSEVMRNYLMLYEPENVATCTVSLGMLCCSASAKNAHISTC